MVGQNGHVPILHRAPFAALYPLLQVGEGGREDEVEYPPEGRCQGDALGQRPARHQFQGAAKQMENENEYHRLQTAFTLIMVSVFSLLPLEHEWLIKWSLTQIT